MESEEFARDIICQVLVGSKSMEKIRLALHTFLPDYTELNLDYASHPDGEEVSFVSEEEMVEYFIETPGVDQVFYWQQKENNPDNIMIGAVITDDDQLVISLTFDGFLSREGYYFQQLKRVFQAETGVISYTFPAEYENGQDFWRKYKNITYHFDRI